MNQTLLAPQNEMSELWRDGQRFCLVTEIQHMEAPFLHILTAPGYRSHYLLWISAEPVTAGGHVYEVRFPATGTVWDIALTGAPELYGEQWCLEISKEREFSALPGVSALTGVGGIIP